MFFELHETEAHARLALPAVLVLGHDNLGDLHIGGDCLGARSEGEFHLAQLDQLQLDGLFGGTASKRINRHTKCKSV